MSRKSFKKSTNLKKEYFNLVRRLERIINVTSKNQACTRSIEIETLNMTDGALDALEILTRLEKTQPEFFDQAISEKELMIISQIQSMLTSAYEYESEIPEIKPAFSRLKKRLNRIQNNNNLLTPFRDIFYLLKLRIPQEPLVREIIVEVDYDASLNTTIREHFKWGAGGWDSRYVSRWEAINFDEIYRNAVLNSMKRYAWLEKGTKKILMSLINFQRPITSERVDKYFRENGLRPANPKELLACGRRITIHGDEYKQAGFLPQPNCPVVALSAIEMFEGFIFGSGQRVLALEFGIEQSGQEMGTVKPRIEFKTGVQSYADTEWSEFVSFAAVDQPAAAF